MTKEFFKQFVKSLWETAKLPLRVLLFSVLSGGVNWWTTNLSLLKLSATEVAIITVALTLIDKALHEWGKSINSPTLVKGISQF